MGYFISTYLRNFSLDMSGLWLSDTMYRTDYWLY